LNDLLRGKIDKFSLDALFDLVGRAGLKVSIVLNTPPKQYFIHGSFMQRPV